MKIVEKSAPHLRKPNASVVRMMRDVVIALMPLVIFAIYNHGLDAVVILAAAIGSMVGTEYIYYQIVDYVKRDRTKHEEIKDKIAGFNKQIETAKAAYQEDSNQELYDETVEKLKAEIRKAKDELRAYKQASTKEENKRFHLFNRNFTLYNYSILVSGIIFGLTVPDSTHFMIVIIGGVAATLLVKMIFGGMGQNIFNIAGFARAFIALGFGAAVGVSNHLPVQDDGSAGATVLGSLTSNPFTEPSTFSIWDMFSGIGFPGAIGEASALLILAGALYMFVRKSFDVFVPLVYVGTVFVLSTAVMVQQDIGWWYPMTHIFSGGLLFGAVFMATDPITIPVTRPGRVYFAFGLGVITFVIRLFGQYPEGVVFAILIMNMFVPAIDYAKWSKNKFSLKSSLIFSAVILLTIFAVWVGASNV